MCTVLWLSSKVIWALTLKDITFEIILRYRYVVEKYIMNQKHFIGDKTKVHVVLIIILNATTYIRKINKRLRRSLRVIPYLHLILRDLDSLFILIPSRSKSVEKMKYSSKI